MANKIIAVALGGIACLFFIIAVGTRGWTTVDSNGFVSNAGLFSIKTKALGQEATIKVNKDFYGSSDEGKEAWAKTQATRAFVILSILVSAAGIGVTFIGQAVPGAAAFGVAALCGLISTAVFADLYNDTSESSSELKLGYSFALNIVAFILCLPAAFFAYRSADEK